MIHLIGEDARSVPDWFRRRLRDVDPALVVYFNPFKEHFCIDRCTRGRDCLSSDHISCPKTPVMNFPHVGEAALDQLKGMDAWTKYSTFESMTRERENAKAEYDAKVKEDSRQGYREAALDNRVQINKALHLIQQHDIARPHK